MSRPTLVRGTDCLEYINKPIGFGTMRGEWSDSVIFDEDIYGFKVKGYTGQTNLSGNMAVCNSLYKVPHNTSKRVCAYVTDNFSDGGIRCVILGDETLNFRSGEYGGIKLQASCNQTYSQVIGSQEMYKNDFNFVPNVVSVPSVPRDSSINLFGENRNNMASLTFSELLDYTFDLSEGHIPFSIDFLKIFKYANADVSLYTNLYTLTTDPDNTLSFGEHSITSNLLYVGYENAEQNPLTIINGDLYSWGNYMASVFYSMCPDSFFTQEYLEQYELIGTQLAPTFNGCCIPYNIVLTNNLQYARNYVNNGELPPDAYLFPLDWNNLPRYTPQPPGQDDDDDDGGNPDDDAKPSRDVDPTPVVAPSLLPTMFNANNMYWLNIGEFNNFLIWFWYDIQQFSVLDPTTWDNLIDNINGLYAQLSSAIIGVRYYPIDPEWVGGLGSQEVIKIAQVQKDGLVDTISKLNVPPIRDIGSYKVNKDFDSFLDLPPYSELTLYLPYYGYIQLDMDMFNGHSIDVKATYDILSGTITYYIFYDDTFMVNTYTAKMAVDVPITLQTSYDRDRAIQNNIATSLSGFMSAGAGMMSGNPIGMVMGISSLNTSVSPQNTAPIKVEGMTVEQGSLYLPSKCAVILRRPVTTKKGTSFAKNNGYLYCKTAKLSDLTGLTIVKNPRIRFNGTEYYNDSGQPTGKMLLPLETEIQEIYSLLEKGVIL